jgi:uncharacterized circularly permuted ATP-grasp superfamily protein
MSSIVPAQEVGVPAPQPSAPADLLAAGRSWFEENEVNFGLVAGGELTQRPIPFCPMPRQMLATEWTRLAEGLRQRVAALDEFVRDIFGPQRILRSGRIPAEVIYETPSFMRAAASPAATQPGQVCVAGIDMVKVNGRWLVLEDNLRVPSGASYSIAARRASADLLSGELAAAKPLSMGSYPRRLLSQLQERASGPGEVVLLSPGTQNPAFWEHQELARQMNLDVVFGWELIASQRGCWRVRGNERIPIAAVYHRFSPEYLDPVVRNDSLIGVPFLLAAWRTGSLGLVNTPTCGVADDKAVFPYVPDIIRYYLAEQPILEQPPTLDMRDPVQRRHAFDNAHGHVFKPVNASGGKGIVFGPDATDAQLATVHRRVAEFPGSYVAQPVLEIERLPCLADGGQIEHRRCDLRAFVLHGEDPWVMPGGLTRVAPSVDNWLVNSSAGGGIKDTWIIPC